MKKKKLSKYKHIQFLVCLNRPYQVCTQKITCLFQLIRITSIQITRKIREKRHLRFTTKVSTTFLHRQISNKCFSISFWISISKCIYLIWLLNNCLYTNIWFDYNNKSKEKLLNFSSWTLIALCWFRCAFVYFRLRSISIGKFPSLYGNI